MTADNLPPPNSTKVEDFEEEKVEGGFTLAEMDALIAQEDPEFTHDIAEIQSDHSKSELNIEMLDLDDMLKQSEGKTLKARLKRAKMYLRSKVSLMWVHSLNSLRSFASKSWDFTKASNESFQLKKRAFGFLHPDGDDG